MTIFSTELRDEIKLKLNLINLKHDILSPSILQLLASDFPETAAARLEEVRKVEKSTKRPPKTKGQKIVNIGLNLVGMLRPPGFGNLQGFFGYSTGFLGLPLELLLGVQNDGDTPEVREREIEMYR